MGREAACHVRFGRRRSAGRAQLETAELIFRGEFRLVIPYREIRSLEARDGRLRVVWPLGTAEFELGAEAAKWAERIRNPKSLIDKLGVKPGMRVGIVGVDDEAFARDVASRAGEVWRGRPKRESDLVFYGLDRKTGLEKLAVLRGALKPAGALWVVWPKGRPALKEDDVRAAAIRFGLVDVKVAAFSPTLSALKLVIPVAKR